MKRDDWGDRWRDGQIGFHQDKVTDVLDRYADRVWGPARSGRVLVPLCGKSLDMVYLARRFERVVGVEYVSQAVVDFFAEQNLQPEIVPGPPTRYRAENYELVAADFFRVTNEHTGPIDAVFDRASLVALDGETRIRYAEHVRSLLSARAKVLLVTFDYDQTEMYGPPFAVSDEEVGQLFADGFEIEHLQTRDALSDMFRDRGVTRFTESAFALTRT
jgi:thiopurine S-methyltransferase